MKEEKIRRKGKKEGCDCGWAEEETAGIFWVLTGTGGGGAAPVLDGDQNQLCKRRENLGFLSLQKRKWVNGYLGILMKK